MITAGLLQDTTTTTSSDSSSGSGSGDTTTSAKETQSEHQRRNNIKLVDVGIGCGDQTIYLTRSLTRPAAATAEGPSPSKEPERRPLFDSYVGITIAPPQAEFAKERVRKIDDASSTSTAGKNGFQGRSTSETRIFAADAADPASWNPELQQAVFGDAEREGTQDAGAETWLLALDTLYHFKPSREPLLRRACRDLGASFMAFDLLISEHASFFDKLVLRLMCLVTGIPFSNFLRKKEYEDMLVDVGYERHLIEMRDISEHVFSGIAGYIWKKDRELKRYGMSMGKFRGPAKAFDWWARSGLVRGFTVVARRTD